MKYHVGESGNSDLKRNMHVGIMVKMLTNADAMRPLKMLRRQGMRRIGAFVVRPARRGRKREVRGCFLGN